ncbi:MAG: dephospho-CoA kinase [Bacteroidota bacterium]
MKTLGVTGGIGSGKSAVCRVLGDLGARVVYADAVAKRLMHEDATLRSEIAAAFGAGSYDAGGALNRAHLAARVFGDEAQVARLNAIVHPRVRAEMLRLIDAARADGVALLVYEAALIFETGADALLDAVAVVDAPVETRVARVMARDGATREAVLARMGHQLPPADLRARADFVIENGGGLAALRSQVEALYVDLAPGDAGA